MFNWTNLPCNKINIFNDTYLRDSEKKMMATYWNFDLPTEVDPEHWRTAMNIAVVRQDSIVLSNVYLDSIIQLSMVLYESIYHGHNLVSLNHGKSDEPWKSHRGIVTWYWNPFTTKTLFSELVAERHSDNDDAPTKGTTP